MRKSTTNHINSFLDQVQRAGKTRTKEIRLSYDHAVELSLALTELLNELHDHGKSPTVIAIPTTGGYDGGKF